MRPFLIKLGVTALSLGVASQLLSGIYIANITTFIVAAFLLNIFNAILRPIFVFLTLPITVVTFGLFLFILNGFIFYLVAYFLPGFAIATFGEAVLGWIITGISSWITMVAIGEQKSNNRR